ncbi:MAG: transglutaminase domain-containing protein [Deltaproteobacteria bacterium]|nr:transglutaminase domain-containing protein [Deltaproteobacteria bacterium]
MRVWLRWLAPAPIVIAAVALAEITGGRGVVAFAALPAVLAWPRGGRVALGVPAQVLVLIGCAMTGLVLAPFLPALPDLGSDALRPAWAQLGLGALLFAGVRLHLAAPAWGLAGTFGIGVLIFIACGTVQSGAFFPTVGVVYTALAFAALAVDGEAIGTRTSSTPLDLRHVLATGILLAVAGSITISLAAVIPRFYSAVYNVALRYIDQRHRAGFHDGAMRLGALDGLLQSSEVVLRVIGDAGDLLRGNVYVHYSNGRWLPMLRQAESLRREMSVEAARERGEVIRAEVWWASDQHDRFFLPSTPGKLALSPARVRVDELGVVRTAASEPAMQLLVLATDDRPFPAAAPRPIDLDLDDALRVELVALAEVWTGAADSDVERLDALRAHLESGYSYSLEVSARGLEAGRDPVLRFLQDERRGHCEYFASAITLLARASGLPARLVTGYRVAEHNPIGGYAIVRERHAHAWSEVHVAGRGWVSVDPSPLRGARAAELIATPFWPGVLDYALLQWHARGPQLLLVVLVTGLALVQGVRIVRGRRPPRSSPEIGVRPPPGWLAALLRKLSERGHARGASESLEALARRVQAAEVLESAATAPLGEAAVLLRRYAALRYGGEGDAEGLQNDVERWVRESGRRARTGATPPLPSR